MVTAYFVLPVSNQKEIKKLNAKVDDMDKKLSQLADKVDRINNRMDGIETQLKDTISRLDKLIEMHAEDNAKLKKLEDSQEILRNSFEGFKYKVNSVQTQT
jgi:septal ring factor EnvC (AmiA/AmiB activator)